MSSFAIVSPYRNRPDHLRLFLAHYSALFPDATIYIIEQEEGREFNRGALLNIGFLLSTEPYVVFNDIDMLVTAGEKMYKFPPAWPTMLATRVQQFGYRMPFKEYFGGVTMFTREQFEKVNGYSNNFWGWGGEDNEMYDNVKKFYGISYRNCYYESLHHEKERDLLPSDHPNYIYWKQGRNSTDGLSNCKFNILHQSGTHYRVVLLDFLKKV